MNAWSRNDNDGKQSQKSDASSVTECSDSAAGSPSKNGDGDVDPGSALLPKAATASE